MTQPGRRVLDVWVVLPERVLLLDIAGPMEVLRRANVEQDALQFNVRYAGSKSRALSSGRHSAHRTSRRCRARFPTAPCVVVPGSADTIAFGEDPGQAVVRQDEHESDRRMATILRSTRPHADHHMLGRFLLAARAGLLDGFSRIDASARRVLQNLPHWRRKPRFSTTACSSSTANGYTSAERDGRPRSHAQRGEFAGGTTPARWRLLRHLVLYLRLRGC